MTKFTILVGGVLHLTSRLRRQVAGSRAIAADSGMAHAALLGLNVELWVGDFDSASPELVEQHSEIERRVFPVAKDATDSELAVRAARERGATAIVLAGGFGGQTDHALAHILLGVRLESEGIDTLITSGSEEAYPLLADSARRLELPHGSRMSIVAFSALEGLTITGVEWPLERRHVSMGSTLTLSNVARGPVTVSLGRGHGVIIAYPENPHP
jgi:thiamine pyrophosphokinase